jgi:hypothetical protein
LYIQNIHIVVSLQWQCPLDPLTREYPMESGVK